VNLSVGTLLIGGAAGLALALFGVKMLVTGTAPGSIARAFRTVRDAGFYHALFGVALIVLVVGTMLAGVAAAVAAGVALLLVAVAIIRHRPRGRSAGTAVEPEDAEKPGDLEKHRTEGSGS
jgi:hypothetical protein